MSPDSTPPKKPKRHRVSIVVSVLAIGAVGLAVSGIMDRARSKQEVAAWTNAQTIPTVRVVRPERGSADQDLALPGNVAAFVTGSLYARASGYITAWNEDIGAHVTKGEVLATVSAPDLDQQLEEAKGQLVQMQAAVEQAQANADLGKVTDQRTAQLVAEGWSSKQQGDTDHLTAAARVAAVSVAKANVVAQQAASNALAENSRTALIELQADNPGGKLWPGAFAEVHFHIPADADTLSVPLTALVFGAHGMQVAALDDGDKVVLKPVVLGRNLGNRVEIESGLSLSDRLVDSPLESTQTGDQVTVAKADPEAVARASTASAKTPASKSPNL